MHNTSMNVSLVNHRVCLTPQCTGHNLLFHCVCVVPVNTNETEVLRERQLFAALNKYFPSDDVVVMTHGPPLV